MRALMFFYLTCITSRGLALGARKKYVYPELRLGAGKFAQGIGPEALRCLLSPVVPGTPSQRWVCPQPARQHQPITSFLNYVMRYVPSNRSHNEPPKKLLCRRYVTKNQVILAGKLDIYDMILQVKWH